MYDTLNKINEKMYCELDDITKKETLDSKDVELIYKFVDIVKDINEIGISPEGYSQMNGYMRGRSGGMMPMYGRSYNYNRDNNGYSRNDNKDMMLEHLQNVADMAMDEKDRKAVERLISQMQSQ